MAAEAANLTCYRCVIIAIICVTIVYGSSSQVINSPAGEEFLSHPLGRGGVCGGNHPKILTHTNFIGSECLLSLILILLFVSFLSSLAPTSHHIFLHPSQPLSATLQTFFSFSLPHFLPPAPITTLMCSFNPFSLFESLSHPPH